MRAPPSVSDTLQSQSILMSLSFFLSQGKAPGLSLWGTLEAERRAPGWMNNDWSPGSRDTINNGDTGHVGLGLGHCSQRLVLTLTATL